MKQDAVDTAHERYGFFALISNEVKDPVTALSLYRMRDVVEKAFWNVKERLNLRRTIKYPSDSTVHIQKPEKFNEMLNLARTLSAEIPYVRVDF